MEASRISRLKVSVRGTRICMPSGKLLRWRHGTEENPEEMKTQVVLLVHYQSRSK